MTAERQDHEIPVAGSHLAAWVWSPPGATTCVVMGHGFSLTRHDRLADYAAPLVDAGAAVVAFDHRFLGDSPGTPRQRFRKAEHQEDWRAAIAFARRLPRIERVVVWGFSFGAGNAITVAAQDGAIAGVLALCPFLDGRARALGTSPAITAWITPRAVLDAAGRHTTIPVTAPDGERAAMSWPGEYEGFRRATVDGSPWRNEISPSVFLTVAFFRPVTLAKTMPMPVWVGLGEEDITVSKGAVERFATRAPRGELLRYPRMDHFDPFVGDAPALIGGDQASFLRRHGLV